MLRSMSQQRKILPGGTTLHANDSLPMIKRSWCWYKCVLGYASRMAERISSLCSTVMDALITSELSRRLRVVAGTSVFSGLMDSLLAEHAWVIAAKFYWHVLEFGGPNHPGSG